MSQLIDISLPLMAGMPVYPGTAETIITKVPSGSGSSVLSEISFTSHAGTHIDAPSHSLTDSKNIDDLDLGIFYGPCRVLDLTDCATSITTNDLASHDIQRGERVLFKTTNSLRGFSRFYDDYVYLEGQTANYLAELGTKLVGIDALSIKKRGLKDNTAHTALLTKDIPILEGLDLSKVDAGIYTLCAFPLAFRGLDGSPTRAVLIRS